MIQVCTVVDQAGLFSDLCLEWSMGYCSESLTLGLFVVVLMGKEETTSGELLARFLFEETRGYR